MGLYIVVTLVFLFFMGVMSLLIDSLYIKKKYIKQETYEAPATVILEDYHNINFEEVNY